MLERVVAGDVPPKHHTQLRSSEGQLRYEECFTREGFDGPYTILYHQHRPHVARVATPTHGWTMPALVEGRPLARRHYLSQKVKARGRAPIDARLPLLTNADVTLSVLYPDANDPVYFVNADGDELMFVLEGGGTVHTPLGSVTFAKHDYVHVPRGMIHRYDVGPGAQHWLSMECKGGLSLPRQWRNEVGQLRLDAPYCHRDFRLPKFSGPRDEGLREVVTKRDEKLHAFAYQHSVFDVVGWDGAVYPWAFPISCFQPRVGLVHLPPTWHGTFAARGALICSFVPRPVDFHPQAIPCPYPHSSVDCDEFIFYCDGNFTSRKGVGPGSISHHPMGVPHGPHPGAYENSIGSKVTTELAVMLDTFLPLTPTQAALEVEDAGYHDSFIG
ncbi:MAG: homogentisate 1,2-dioxygenase [Archangiaceae bacterium]|nr:homogentisate 1,2-dioxygenase [Archangiaceae bacterium]